MWKKFKEWLKKEWDKLLDKNLPNTDGGHEQEPEPEKPADPATPTNPADNSEVANKFSHSATITHHITYIRHNEGGVYFSNPRLNWASGELVGECHLAVVRAGRWTGGKFDHVRATTTSRDFKNIHDGYGRFGEIGEPRSGELCAFYLVSYDDKKRTNALFFNWI